MTAFETLFGNIINGSPESTSNKRLHDGSLEEYPNIAQTSRRQLNFHGANGTDIPSILHAVVSGVIGSGVNIQSRSQDQKINIAFEALLKTHAKDKNFDTTGRFHRNEAFRKIVHFENLNGGVIVRHHYNNAWAIPYRLELVGIDMIDTSKNHGKYLENGLQKDKYGRITHIYLFVDAEKRVSKAFSMKNMTYHMATWMSLSQYTAVSRLVTILPTLDEVLQYSSAEVRSALERAKAGVYWGTELYGTILQALNEEFKTANATVGEKVVEAKKLLEGLSKRGLSATGATPIPVEDKIHTVDSKTDSVYDVITQQSQKSMSSSVGGSSVSVYKDIAVGNYASIKAAISFDEEHYKMEFDRLLNKVINEYLERLFMVGVQMGVIPVSRAKYFKNRDMYHVWDVLRQSKRVIDESKNATATAKELESGTTTLNRVYAEKGLDYITETEKQIDIDIQVELLRKEKYEKAGLEYVPKGAEKKDKEVTE